MRLYLCMGQAASKDDVGPEPLHGKRLIHFGVEQLQRSLQGQQQWSSISKAGLKQEEAQSKCLLCLYWSQWNGVGLSRQCQRNGVLLAIAGKGLYYILSISTEGFSVDHDIIASLALLATAP